MLRLQVERVGGFPVVLKVQGRSSGIGVMLAESMASLRSIADYTAAIGHHPLLCQFIRDARHWRIVVLGGQAIASYRNRQPENDFRSCGSTEREDFDAKPSATVVDIALRATMAMNLEFAGVDVLEDPAGKAWFLEANFPCYYPQAQLHGGVDIAGQMVDFLLARAGGKAQPSP
jgi:ribosomal protein S6--L-glutamate ligase